jgi:hypothetical protein
MSRQTATQSRRLQQVAPGRYEAGPWTATRCTYMGKWGRATGYEVTLALAGITITLSDPYSIEGPTARTIDDAETLVGRMNHTMLMAVLDADPEAVAA